MLRMRTKNQKNVAVYVDKNLKNAIENFFNNHFIKSQKINCDNYLQYGHAIFLVLYIAICFL